MKKIVIGCIFIIVIMSLIGIGTKVSYSTGSVNSDYLRIHIRANSNSEIDQDIKYQIKDDFVAYLTPLLSCCTTKQMVIDLVKSKINELKKIADNKLMQNHLSYTTNIRIDSELFPTRSYEGYTLESGIYDAIIVELGEAKGNNWWCVIYPPLCFVNCSKSESSLVVYKSKILEIIKQFFK